MDGGIGGPLRMKTYLGNNSGAAIANWTKHLSDRASQDALAEQVIQRVDLAREHVRAAFGVEWSGCRLLDVGCGQLVRHGLVLGVDNTVVGIDWEIPLRPPYVGDVIRCARSCGLRRVVKTSVRQMLRVDRRYHAALRERLGVADLPKVETIQMDAENLAFEDAVFDGAYSFSTFQHIGDPGRALREVARVLKPGGVGYIDLHLYTSPGGSDHPYLRTGRAYPPWGHLRPTTKFHQRHGLFVNGLRMQEWMDLVRAAFAEVRFVSIEHERDEARQALTEELRDELAEYSEEELVTSTFIAVARK
jgi:SAM-dependent methyltransferase